MIVEIIEICGMVVIAVTLIIVVGLTYTFHILRKWWK
jgi:hypothetical protein